MREPVWTYEDLWEDIRNPPFGVEINPKLFSENNFIIAKFYEKQKNYKAAKTYYQSVADDYKNTKWAVKALEKIRDVSSKIQ